MWSEEEKMNLWGRWCETEHLDDTDRCYEVATRAVELKAASGGTMTAEQISVWKEVYPQFTSMGEHVTAQGARIAVLERDLARKGFDPGSPAETAIRALEHRLAEAEHARNKAMIDRSNAEAIISSIRPLISQLAALSVEMAKVVGESSGHESCPDTPCPGHHPYCEGVDKDVHPRYPCSPTCTHDDAATPGHAERVKEKSEAVSAAAASGFMNPQQVEAWEKGSEAMRAACIASAIEWARTNRYLSDHQVTCLKGVLEGATP